MSCRACEPELFPDTPRQGPHHLAARFGDWGHWWDIDYIVYRNGKEVLNVIEVFLSPGNPSKAVCLEMKNPSKPKGVLNIFRQCECGEGFAEFWDTAYWTVRKKEREQQ